MGHVHFPNACIFSVRCMTLHTTKYLVKRVSKAYNAEAEKANQFRELIGVTSQVATFVRGARGKQSYSS